MNRGVFAVLAASFLYGMMPTMTKLALNEGMPDGRVVFYRMIIAAGAAFIAVIATGNSFKVSLSQLLQLCVFGTLGYGVTAALTAASYAYIPTGLATMLQFTYPLYVTIFMTLVFREKLSPVKLFACLLAVTGLGLMADFSSISPLGIILATLSGLSYASYVIAGKKSGFRALPGIVIVFYSSFFSSLFCLARVGLTGKMCLPPNFKALTALIVTAVFCTVTPRFLLNLGIRRLGPATASVLNMPEPVVGLIAGAVIFNEAIGIRGLIGCALVLIRGVATALASGGEEEKVKVHINTKRLG